MTTPELQLRLALLNLMDEFKRILDESCKDPTKNDAYKEAKKLMESLK